MPDSNHPSYLAFDLGASGSSAIVGTLVDGSMRMQEVHRFKTPLIEESDHLFWDLDPLWNDLRKGLHKALEVAPDLKSLSTSSWGVDYVSLTEEGQPVRAPYSYRDARTEGFVERVAKRVSSSETYRLTGIQPLPINTLYQVLADQAQEADRAQQVASRLLIADYINYRFGGRPVAETTLASTTQLLHAGQRAWATNLMERLDIDPARWPEVVRPGTTIGHLESSKFDVRHSDIQIVAGCSHDTACAVAAVPARPETRWAFLSCGTWSLMGVERDEPILNEAALRGGFTNEAGLNDTVRFLRNLTGLWVLQECERMWEEAGQQFDYDMLIEEARSTDEPVAEVDLQDERFGRRGEMPEKLRAYCREHDLPVPEQRGAVVRCVLKSLAATYRRTLEALSDVTADLPAEVLHVVGGGAKNDLLCQMIADACSCRVVVGPAEATALGNLLVQAQSAGDLQEAQALRDVARQSATFQTYEPQMSRT